MSSQTLARLAALFGILAGVAALGGGLYAHFASPQPTFGIPSYLGITASWTSGVHQLVGLGVIMLVGGLVTLRWPALGVAIVCAGAMLGLIGVYDRGRPPVGDELRTRWVPYLYYWAAPWVFAWVSGIFVGLFLEKTVKQYGRPLETETAPAPSVTVTTAESEPA